MERDSGVKEFIPEKEKNVAKSGFTAIRCTITTIYHILPSHAIITGY